MGARSAAILATHTYGTPCDTDGLQKVANARRIPLFFDAAHAFGSRRRGVPVGRFGDAEVFSLSPTKLLVAGEGGLIATDDDELADRVAMLAFHGSTDKRDFRLVGYNSRLDELQAAFLRVFLPRLSEWNRSRREAATRYAELGLGEAVELPGDEPGHVYHLFVCRSPERDRVRAALSEAGIESASYYTTPLHLQPALRFLGWGEGSLPETERAARENFSLPLWPSMPAAVQEEVAECVRAAVSAPVG
jgi:dTDP-4-amino-4,6-dideoxygalactose transaminase